MNDGCQYGWRWSAIAFIMNALMLENFRPECSIAAVIARFWPSSRPAGQAWGTSASSSRPA